MRSALLVSPLALVALACNPKEEGRAKAKQEAEAFKSFKETKAGGAAVAKKPPVERGKHIPCEQLLNASSFGKRLDEPAPVSVSDQTEKDSEAAAVCAIERGGKRPDAAAQAAMLKKGGKLGVLPGDPICSVYAYCWTFEDPDRFTSRCKDEAGATFDASLGFPACVRTIATGEHDVKQYRLYDADTQCMFKIVAGPSMVDNDVIGKCAKAAHDLIGPSQIGLGDEGGGAADEPAPIKL